MTLDVLQMPSFQAPLPLTCAVVPGAERTRGTWGGHREACVGAAAPHGEGKRRGARSLQRHRKAIFKSILPLHKKRAFGTCIHPKGYEALHLST